MIADSPLWNLALIVSRLHLVWISAVCGKLETPISLLQHPGLEHFPCAASHPEKQG